MNESSSPPSSLPIRFAPLISRGARTNFIPRQPKHFTRILSALLVWVVASRRLHVQAHNSIRTSSARENQGTYRRAGFPRSSGSAVSRIGAEKIATEAPEIKLSPEEVRTPMTHRVDIFQVEPRGVRWLGSAETLERAKLRLRELTPRPLGSYILLDQSTGNKIILNVGSPDRAADRESEPDGSDAR